MTKTLSKRDMFAIAIDAENAARDFYRLMTKLFAHEPAAAAIWREMMEDEVRHARQLREIREASSGADLDQPVEREWSDQVEALESLIGTARKLKTEDLATLDDGFVLATRLEESEVNNLFRFLMGGAGDDRGIRSMVRDELTLHHSKLVTLRNSYDRRKRNSVKAHWPES